MGRYLAPLLLFAMAAGIAGYDWTHDPAVSYVYLWGVDWAVGPDPVRRGAASVALLAALGGLALIGAIRGHVRSLRARAEDDQA